MKKNNEISIVTAFFDIGRGSWGKDPSLPHFVPRSTDTYFERFSHLAKLENEMVIYTSEDLVDQIKAIRGDKPTKVISVDYKNMFESLRNKITEVQSNPDYQKMINPAQIKMPEYWNADYVLVNALKSVFVNDAIDNDFIHNDLVSWLDFGYCRNEDTLNGVTKWCYDFDTDKIHLFKLKDWKEGTYIQDVIANNDVHMTGPCIVAGKSMWLVLKQLIEHNMNELLINNLVDDDQTLLLMSYLIKPEIFELHQVSDNDWFVAFKDFNK
jgi:protein YibB